MSAMFGGHLGFLISSVNHLRRLLIDLSCLMPLSAIFQLYHGNQF